MARERSLTVENDIKFIMGDATGSKTSASHPLPMWLLDY